MDGWFPENPYLARGEQPWVGGVRPINQGDVFCDIPVVYGVKHPLTKPPKVNLKANERVIVTTHPPRPVRPRQAACRGVLQGVRSLGNLG